jgi:hypothetical protein
MQRSQSDFMSVLEPHNILQKLGAGFIGVFGLGASAYIFSRFFPDSLPIWINGLLLVAGFFVFAVLATAISRGKGSRDSAR